MSNYERKFPSYFPDDCPPKAAKYGELTVYRWVKGNPLSEEDFKPVREMYPNREFPQKDYIKSYGISTFTDINDLDKLLKFVPKLKKICKYKAYGLLNEEHGVYLETSENNNSHVTWWIYEGVNLHMLFKVC